MKLKFTPIKERSAEIIEAVMASPDIPNDDPLRFRIRLCTEEVVENIVRYAYPEGVENWMEIVTSQEGNLLVLTFTDSGLEFDPLGIPDPDVTLEATERPIGGLGIFLCKQMTEEMTYRRDAEFNILTMKIKIK